MQRDRGGPFGAREVRLGRQRDAVTHELEELDILRGEGASRQRSDVEDATNTALGHQRDTQQRPDPLGVQQGIDDVAAADVFEHHGLRLGRNPAGEPSAQWHAHALPDLLLYPACDGRDQLIGPGFEQKYGRGVDAEEIADPIEQLDEQVFETELGQRRIGDRLDASQSIVRRFGRDPQRRHGSLDCTGLLLSPGRGPSRRSAMSLPVETIGEQADLAQVWRDLGEQHSLKQLHHRARAMSNEPVVE